MSDGVEPSDAFVGAFSTKHPGGEKRAIEAPVFSDEVSSECLGDLTQRRLSGLEDLPSDRVGVRGHGTQRSEHARHRGLPGTDAAAHRNDATRPIRMRCANRTNKRGRACPAAQSHVHTHRVALKLLLLVLLMQELGLLENPHHQASSSDADSQ